MIDGVYHKRNIMHSREAGKANCKFMKYFNCTLAPEVLFISSAMSANKLKNCQGLNLWNQGKMCLTVTLKML